MQLISQSFSDSIGCKLSSSVDMLWAVVDDFVSRDAKNTTVTM